MKIRFITHSLLSLDARYFQGQLCREGFGYKGKERATLVVSTNGYVNTHYLADDGFVHCMNRHLYAHNSNYNNHEEYSLESLSEGTGLTWITPSNGYRYTLILNRPGEQVWEFEGWEKNFLSPINPLPDVLTGIQNPVIVSAEGPKGNFTGRNALWDYLKAKSQTSSSGRFKNLRHGGGN